MELSRRKLLAGVGAGVIGGSPVILASDAMFSGDDKDTPKVLSYSQWQTVQAITARLIPSDEKPGALEAHCVNFIDKALAAEEKPLAGMYRQSLEEIDRIVALRYRVSLWKLPDQQQDEFLLELQTGKLVEWQLDNVSQNAFFETLLAHTVMGFLSDPKYGGNRDHVGWKLAGFPGHVHMLGGASHEHMQGRKPFRTQWGQKL
ncbi:gluconate 2-dehydrogenase subunit 3 family protein [Pseudomaricurvus alkylphenolicus]|uniref:gluconate 2-dehydrogenase subunit 3 family protein n=1 Tax=Pseudomaricurvus alkylphenolicus TaxID=1306991 RepID=UPI0014230A55|nr:gluconate 2-dehydrogenase subunit 3 family protein [Pseudomaricurvus alkylphenolicus]NIB40820.1 gluconate 2-dehydrogenase subunit 3 family protein [Pseudomaricurvus alkylphenolicus]